MNTGGRYFDLVRSEDYVECFMFPSQCSELPIKCEQLCEEFNKFVDALAEKYIWHKDIFKIVVPVLSAGLPPHLYAVLHHGDNIEDEWFVVYLMLELSKQFSDLIIRIVDSDGEFLLIESADVLPDWADPANCEGRVFVTNGEVRFLAPSTETEVEDAEDVSISALITDLRDCKHDVVISKNITCLINKRLSVYPNRIEDSLHRTTVYTPVGVAAILKEMPILISAAVQAFCNRDPIDMKACRAMKYFPPETRVNTSVLFTKCLYAMLMHSPFNPDRKIGWNLPLSSSSEYQSHSLGIKLACGFEILASQVIGDLDFNEKGWLNYCEMLKKRGYFKELLPGSKDHSELLEKAKDYYIKNEIANEGPNIGKKIINLLNSLNCDLAEYSKFEKSLPPDDDDSWLIVDPKELDSLLEEKYGSKNASRKDGGPLFISKKITDFLYQKSGVDGVELNTEKIQKLGVTENYFEAMPQRPKRGVKRKGKKKKNVSFSTEVKTVSPKLVQNKIDFDPDQFSNALQNILDLMIPEDNWDLDSGTDFSEYGSDKDVESHIDNLSKNEKSCDSSFENYVKDMDNELESSTINASLVKDRSNKGEAVDVKQNLYKNIVKSFREEAGGPGPAGNIFGSLGITKHDMLQAIDSDDDED